MSSKKTEKTFFREKERKPARKIGNKPEVPRQGFIRKIRKPARKIGDKPEVPRQGFRKKGEKLGKSAPSTHTFLRYEG